jgi:hypothetical protein
VAGSVVVIVPGSKSDGVAAPLLPPLPGGSIEPTGSSFESVAEGSSAVDEVERSTSARADETIRRDSAPRSKSSSGSARMERPRPVVWEPDDAVAPSAAVGAAEADDELDEEPPLARAEKKEERIEVEPLLLPPVDEREKVPAEGALASAASSSSTGAGARLSRLCRRDVSGCCCCELALPPAGKADEPAMGSLAEASVVVVVDEDSMLPAAPGPGRPVVAALAVGLRTEGSSVVGSMAVCS